MSRACAVEGNARAAAAAASPVRRNISPSATVAAGPVTDTSATSPCSTTCVCVHAPFHQPNTTVRSQVRRALHEVLGALDKRTPARGAALLCRLMWMMEQSCYG